MVSDRYYHAINPDDALFANNIKVNSGIITSASLLRSHDPNLTNMLSPYEAFTREAEKEETFERIRSTEFPLCPPRMGAIFLFERRQAADKANQAWWQEIRVILEAEVVAANRIGRFDASQLDEAWS